MKKSRYLIGAILLLFVMLWLPMGQHTFLVDHWMKIGTYSVPFILIGAFCVDQPIGISSRFNKYRFIGVLMLIAYIIHQFEEHWIDFFGNYYAFYDFNNNFILGNLGALETTVKPLTKESIFVINTSLVWLVGLLGVLSSPRHLFPLISMASIIIINAIVHVLAALVTWQYNPGLLTSIVIFIPFYFWFLKFIVKEGSVSKKLLASGIIWAFLAHVIMVAGLLMANWYQLFSENTYFIILIVWSLLPLGLYRSKIPQNI